MIAVEVVMGHELRGTGHVIGNEVLGGALEVSGVHFERLEKTAKKSEDKRSEEKR